MKSAQELAQQLEQKQGEFKAFVDTNAEVKDGKPVFHWKGFENQNSEAGIIEFNKRNEELNKLHDDYTQVKSLEDATMKHTQSMKSMREVDRQIPYSADANPEMVNRMGDHRGGSIKTLGDLFMESEAYKANAEKTPSSAGPWAAEIMAPQFQQAVAEGNAIDGAIKATLTTSTGVVPYPSARPGIVRYATQRPTLRSLMPVGDTEGAQMVQFIRQNTQTFGADIVAEGAVKPETTLGTERVIATLEVIAHNIKITDQALRFIPGVRDLIDERGTLGVQLAEEDKLLNYNGSAGWKGFLYQTGVQSDTVGADDQFTAFHRGLTLVQSVGFANSTGFVIHPNDWHQIVTIKDDMGRFIYGDPSAATPEPRLWGVPGVSTTKMTEGTVLQGDFRMASKVWTSGGVRIIVGYVDDDLKRNQQTIIIEEYALLEINLPASFVKQTGY